MNDSIIVYSMFIPFQEKSFSRTALLLQVASRRVEQPIVLFACPNQRRLKGDKKLQIYIFLYQKAIKKITHTLRSALKIFILASVIILITHHHLSN